MKYIFVLAFLLLLTGCAEFGLSGERPDCNGVRPHKSGTGSYPCVCCPEGWRGQ